MQAARLGRGRDAEKTKTPRGRRPTGAAKRAVSRSETAAPTAPRTLPRIVPGKEQLAPRLGRQLLYLSRAHIERLPFEPGEILNHVTLALREDGRGKADTPPTVALAPQREAFIAAMPACLPNVQACGLKWFSSFPANLRQRLPQVSAVVVLSDPHTGLPLAVMDGTWLTAQRGPAMSAVAARLLARPESARAAIIGAGVQGVGHIPALCQVLATLNLIRVYDADPDAAARAVRAWQRKLARLKIEAAATVAEAVRGADVVVTATAIRENPQPAVSADLVKQGALLLPLDLDAMLEPAVFAQADRLYVDSRRDLEALHRAGLLKSDLSGYITGQLGQLVAGRLPGRDADAERIVCLNVGVGCVDIVLAHAVYEKATRLGIGRLLEL